jgi:GntR family transcriptional regulator
VSSPATRGPLYRDIAAKLQDRINAGEWEPGQRIPTEPVLAEQFGVNRLTIRQALGHLRAAGMLDIRQGSGTFVADPAAVLEILVDAGKRLDEGSVHASVKSVTKDVTELVLEYQPDPSPSAAAHLGIERAHLARLDTLVGTGGDPFAVSSYWLDARRFPGLADAWIADATLATVLRERFAVTLFYDWRAFSAAAAGDLEVMHLGGHVGAPLIVRDGVSVDDAGAPVYYVRRRIRSERASYVIHYR